MDSTTFEAWWDSPDGITRYYSPQVYFPTCDDDTENLVDLVSPSNEVSLSDFVIDDQGLTDVPGFPLLDMKGKS